MFNCCELVFVDTAGAISDGEVRRWVASRKVGYPGYVKPGLRIVSRWKWLSRSWPGAWLPPAMLEFWAACIGGPGRLTKTRQRFPWLSVMCVTPLKRVRDMWRCRTARRSSSFTTASSVQAWDPTIVSRCLVDSEEWDSNSIRNLLSLEQYTPLWLLSQCRWIMFRRRIKPDDRGMDTAEDWHSWESFGAPLFQGNAGSQLCWNGQAPWGRVWAQAVGLLTSVKFWLGSDDPGVRVK